MKQPFAKTVNFNAATPVDVADPGSSGTAYVTKIAFLINTHANGKVLQLVDSADVPIIYLTLLDRTAAAGVPDYDVFDFGISGIPMTAGKKVQVVSEASGPTAKAHVEGFTIT